MVDRRVSLRRRADADLPALVEVLAEQQPATGYPATWPLPFDPTLLIRRDGELDALVAVLDGRPVGHVSVERAEADREAGDADPLILWTAAHGCDPDGLALVSALFVASCVRQHGVGRLLLDASVAVIRACGLRPCLDVVAGRSPAASIYAHLGWLNVGECRPSWASPDTPPVWAMILPD